VKEHAAGPGALDGLLVLDATQMLAGPMAGMRLGDLGAEVIKIEGPSGEFNRTHGFEDLTVGGEMTTFLAVNRNKRSFAVDLKHPDGLAAFLELVAEADVFIQNFRHGTAERIGVGYEQLHAVNPRLVYCSISGYGSDGPYRDRPGQDLVLQGYSGSMYSVGAKGDPPVPSALWAADVMSGYQAVIGILSSIVARERTGVGQKVEVDMLSVVLDSQAQELVTYLNTGRQPTRSEEVGAHASIPAPYGVYRTQDGWVTLAMCNLADLGEALDDDWLRTLGHYNDGHVHRDAVYRHIRDRFLQRTTDEWLPILDANGVWAGPVYDYADLERDPHVAALGIVTEQPQAWGPVRTVRVPVQLSETPTTIRRGAPQLGADTRSVLEDLLGYEAARVDGLVAAGAVKEHTDEPTERSEDAT
jgi:crotonobetainyl-CoA:carnitine CoA-transferase CaiB-like acyl-CoA transferase